VAAPLAGTLTGVTIGLNFDGQSAQDNRDLLGFAFVPPDTNGAVGATHFVQTVNVTIAVYDKARGSLQFGPVAIHTIWEGLVVSASLAEAPRRADGGDPVVLYDHLAGRWLVTQLQYDTTFTHTAQCIAVSTSSLLRMPQHIAGAKSCPGGMSLITGALKIFGSMHESCWSGRADLNCRPLAPQASALPG
jgi:hypothetical protein